LDAKPTVSHPKTFCQDSIANRCIAGMLEHDSFLVAGIDVWRWRCLARQQAIAAEIPIAEVDWLLAEVAGLDRLALRLESFKDRAEIPLQRSLADVMQLWQKRLDQRIPLQYLIGAAPWRNFLLTVSPAVLIPRPETELVIDLAVAAVQQTDPGLAAGDWADLGTGSGAIAIGLADAFPQATLHAVDVSPDALAIAQHNADQLGFSGNIRFYQGDWLQPLDGLQGKLSGLVSNPPYIPTSLIPDLQPEVAEHEPHLALDGGTDGLDCIRHLVNQAPRYLKPGGIWLIELMAGQAQAVVDLLNAQGSYRMIQIHPDLAGIDRFVLASRSSIAMGGRSDRPPQDGHTL
jgi:release factor glutamine methyltransferase